VTSSGVIAAMVIRDDAQAAADTEDGIFGQYCQTTEWHAAHGYRFAVGDTQTIHIQPPEPNDDWFTPAVAHREGAPQGCAS
jgi:hypothetical protein